ncbi:MAG: hypothetical protein C0504_10355 [Candidatus Solibacter sp.]|nr:hypothetical protein [Candidatus Solibacter sp.]
MSVLALPALAQRAPHTPPIDAPAVRQSHPRLVFRAPAAPGPGRTFEDLRRLYRTDAFFRQTFDLALAACEKPAHPAMAAACWVVSAEDKHAHAAVQLMLDAPITQSGSGGYSNVWSFALAWDWLHDHPALSGDIRHRAAARIAERLHTELAQLDDTGMALWHGRNQAANGAMSAALALAGLPGQQDNLRRATGHYAEALRALQFSEGWPEGPSYWIYNRTLPYALAADCFLSATGAESVAGIPIRDVMAKIGLWTLYSFGPNAIFEPYGDSVGSLRLGETGMWEASIDYFARLSRHPGAAAAADYLRLRSPAPYGKRPIHWYAALAYDPGVRPGAGYDPQRPELWLRANLPQSMLFGRNSMGVAFMRGGWGDPNELYASFKAGDMLAHHDHYNNGHFSIQLGGLLAPLTGLYGGGATYTGAYRLGYTIQTVASNSLLVLAPNETSRALLSQPNRPWTSLSGGQRVINPTGFDCLSVADFRRLLTSTRHLERADITAVSTVPNKLDYYAADITASYNSTRFAEPGSAAKVSRVTRQFVYLRRERAFVVFDRIDTANPAYTPKFLLHSMSKPEASAGRLLAGNSPDDGILETSARTLLSSAGLGALTHHILLPAAARTLLIGGPNFGSYVEHDGDESNGFNGTNLQPTGGEGKPGPKPGGRWRVEVSPASPSTSNLFLNVLVPRLAADSSAQPQIEMLSAGPDAVAVRVGQSAVVFSRSGKPLDSVDLTLKPALECWLLDAAPGVRSPACRVPPQAQ